MTKISIRAAAGGDDSPERTAAPDQRDPEQLFAHLKDAWEHDSMLTAAWDSAPEAVRQRFVPEVLQGVEMPIPDVLYELSRKASRNYWKAIKKMIREPSDDSLRDYWGASKTLILRRADDGMHEALNSVGDIYANSSPPDFVKADACFILARAQGNRDATKSHNLLVEKMTPEQLEQARRVAAEWQTQRNNARKKAQGTASQPAAGTAGG